MIRSIVNGRLIYGGCQCLALKSSLGNHSAESSGGCPESESKRSVKFWIPAFSFDIPHPLTLRCHACSPSPHCWCLQDAIAGQKASGELWVGPNSPDMEIELYWYIVSAYTLVVKREVLSSNLTKFLKIFFGEEEDSKFFRKIKKYPFLAIWFFEYNFYTWSKHRTSSLLSWSAGRGHPNPSLV